MDVFTYLKSSQFWASIVLICMAVILWLVQRSFVRRLKRMQSLLDSSGRRIKIINFTAALLKVVFILLFVTILLQINGINVGSLIAGLGVTGIIVGFALQDVLKDVMMGVDIVTNSYFSTGDVIRYRTIDGTPTVAKVTGFNMKVTKLKDLKTGSSYTVCNRNISEIEVLSDWLNIRVPASYEVKKEEMEEVLHILVRRILELEGIQSAAYKGISEFGDSAVFYLIRAHVPVEKKDQLQRDINGLIQTLYEEKGLSIPYNQLVVHQAEPDGFKL